MNRALVRQATCLITAILPVLVWFRIYCFSNFSSVASFFPESGSGHGNSRIFSLIAGENTTVVRKNPSLSLAAPAKGSVSPTSSTYNEKNKSNGGRDDTGEARSGEQHQANDDHAACWVVALHHDAEPESEMSIESLAHAIKVGNRYGCRVFVLTTVEAHAHAGACATYFRSNTVLKKAGAFDCEDRVNVGREQSAYAHLWKYERGKFLKCALENFVPGKVNATSKAPGDVANFACVSHGDGPLRLKADFAIKDWRGQPLTPSGARGLREWYETLSLSDRSTLRHSPLLRDWYKSQNLALQDEAELGALPGREQERDDYEDNHGDLAKVGSLPASAPPWAGVLPTWERLRFEMVCLTGVVMTSAGLLRRKPREFYGFLENVTAVDSMGGEASHFSERLTSVFFGGAPCQRRSFECDPKGEVQVGDPLRPYADARKVGCEKMD